MKKLSVSTKIFVWMMIAYAALAVSSFYLPQGEYANLFQAQTDVPKSAIALVNGLIVLIVYGVLGFLGLKLAKKLGWPELWDEKISNRQRFLIPGLIGAVAGVALIIGDTIFSKFNGIGHFIHPPFPTSIVASLSAGIGEEVMFRLFFVSFWVWLVSFVLLKGKYQKQIFWVIAVLSAIAFGAGHYPALMALFGFKTMAAIPWILQAEVILLNGIVGLAAAWLFRQYGFLAAAGVHFWCDIVWHVIWGVIK